MKIYENKKKEIVVNHAFHISSRHLKFRISAPSETWETLFMLSSESPKRVGDQIHLHLAKPAHDYINRSRSRGVHRGREAFMSEMKLKTPHVYCWVLLQMRKPQKSWPKSFKTILSQIPTIKDLKPANMTPAYTTLLIAAWIMEKHFGTERKNHRFKSAWNEDLETFKKTFIARNDIVNHYKAGGTDTLGLENTSLENLLEVS